MAAAFAVASWLSLKIVKPINELNLDEPMGNTDHDVYTEIKPLILRLEQQHRQLQRDRKELEKTSLIRQEFTANASHELKTPLHVISGYAELLENGLVREEDARRFAELIHKESLRMSKLVEDIIDLSALDSGAVGVTRERTDLYRVAQNAVDSLEKTADDAGVTVALQGEHAELNGIPQVLYSLVYNLVLNAVTYSDRGGSVKVSVTRGDHGIRLTVLDHGIGIPLEEQSRIFERFYRVDKSRSKDVGGTGLGLSIVKHAAHIHGAEIKLQSAPGKGSAFTVYFPADGGAPSGT